jgi:2'-hydroxyisoflavone reductase
MNLLVLGGTVFLGRHFVQAALDRGHHVTLFNRGRSNPELFPQVEQLSGDRDGGLSVLAGRKWDAAVDTCGYVPRVVEDSAQILKGAVRQYLFISSVSAYAEFTQIGMDEEAPLATIQDAAVETINGETYGPLKALCEQVVLDIYHERGLVIRPGLIVGPYDPTDRFTYWPKRVAEGGAVLVPENPDWETQIIDARDLANWMVTLLEQETSGVYNAVGPDYQLRFGDIIEACRKISASDARWIWVSKEFLLANEVAPWSQLPLWLPGEEYAGMDQVSNRKALSTGLQFRPLASTLRDTLAWVQTRPAGYQMRAGLRPEREQALLNQWAIQVEKSEQAR